MLHRRYTANALSGSLCNNSSGTASKICSAGMAILMVTDLGAVGIVEDNDYFKVRVAQAI
jgi:hypothetical protein